QDVTVYLIEAENLDFGLDLSAAVQHSADLVLAELITIISQNVTA
ncbi:MAG: hydrogenase maturation protease, partial [Sphaerospermopsis kisseleviana]